MALDERKYSYGLDHALRDTRPLGARLYDWFSNSGNAAITFLLILVASIFFPKVTAFMDVLFLFALFYAYWLHKIPRQLPYKLPSHSKFFDENNQGGGRNGVAEGIMFLGNKKTSSEEVWFTNSDIRTHTLYLGTTGSGKTEGLKSIVANALTWGSGFVYVDGKADTDLWSSLSALCRRFGRDDDLLVLNYMTGNSDTKAPSNSMNPFSSGSAGYLTNLLVSLMPAAEGDNAMWKERAVSLLGSLMPALTYMRDNHGIPLAVSSIRNAMNFPEVVKLSRNESLPGKLRESIKGYLDTLPGYADEAFDDNGQDKPMGPDTPQTDTQVPKQQHGYLTMQFTRSLQSLGDDYGYIFDVNCADVDMIDVVLNRRMLVVLIPALEKSSDETANLGKIVAATIKGMMGTTLGSTVEGTSSTVIENKPTHSATPFVTIFDEVGYYATDGMAVMAAQARSLGFALVYAAQDLPALEKRVKEEARSITANCNIKIFGKLEDPTQTKDFFEKTIGKAIVTQVSGFAVNAGSLTGGFDSQQQASVTFYDRISYDELQGYKEGQAGLYFANVVHEIDVFYSNPGHAKAMRVQKLIGFEKTDDYVLKNLKNIAAMRDRLASKTWTAASADVNTPMDENLQTLIDGLTNANDSNLPSTEQGAMALAHLYATQNPEAMAAKAEKKEEIAQKADDTSTATTTPDGKTDMSWQEIMNAPEKADTNAESDDGEEEDTSSSGSGDSKSPIKEVSREEYSVEDAIAEKADGGATILPENLSDEVKEILKSAADALTAGLFSPPTMDEYAQGGDGDGKGLKAKNISPVQQPGKTGR
ncbi:MAG: type IV secretion protein IcmO [Alphaproteobacteria bacterium]|nr:MAG: type IV secretion protein IcmO [Alphaproteobacteria bacterium]